jgi:predicted MPP superfamily phosphohydrolase
MRSSKLLQEADYDICVFTGDYRAQAFGTYDAALRGMSQPVAKLKQPIYGVLGNHDTVPVDRFHLRSRHETP